MGHQYIYRLHSKKKLRLFMGIFLAIFINSMFLIRWVDAQVGQELKIALNNQKSPQLEGQFTVELTPEEQTYLQQLGKVKIVVDPDWEPYEKINDKGEFEGIAADLLKLIAQRTGISLELVITEDWVESLQAAKTGKAHILSFLNQTPERAEWLLFTEPYFTDPNVFITREDHEFISDPANLSNETIVFPVGTSMEEYIRKVYPNLTILHAESEAEALTMVLERKADMTLRSLTMAAYTIRKEGLFNLKIMGQLPNRTNNFRIGVVKDQPMLKEILDKGVKSITPQEVQQIVNQHISINVQTSVDYSLVFKIIIGFSFLIAGGLYWNYSLKKLNRQLMESEEKYRLLMTRMQQGLAVHELIVDEVGKPVDYLFMDINESFERLTGLKRENIIGKTVLEIMPGTESYWIEKYGHVALTGEPLQYENYSKELDKYFETIAYSPRPKTFAVIISDITQRKKLETDLSNEKNLLETTLISVGDGVISTDNKGKIVFMNKVAECLTGWRAEEARGKSIEEVFHIVDEFTGEKSENIVKKVLENGKNLKLPDHALLISKEGIERPVENSAAPILQKNGEAVGVVLVFRDFSENKQKQEEILYLSYHDQLTGLYNRRFYEEELKRLDTKRNLPLTIIMADVNGLKLINDSFGHALGDELLKKVSEMITKGCRGDDIIARLGGDEFVILLPKTDTYEAKEIIKRIKELSANEKVGSVNISISFGYEAKHNDEEDIQEVFKNAEDHMYRNKLYESRSIKNKTIDLIMNTLYEKSHREMIHSKRVSEICKAIAVKMNFDKDGINQIRIAGLMHDIGKMGVDEKILDKKDSLTGNEWKEIQRHPEIGYRILSSVNEFSEMAGYVLEHHERWDGKGYPKGLRGEEISLQARIIAVADAYDAMTSHMSYRKGISEEEAVNEIRRCSNTQFDPDIARVFIEEVLKKK